jgi:Protein of unknown function (DUF3489)
MAGRRSKRRVESMSIKFTDTQLIILSAAALREDRCLVAPPKLKGGAAQKFAAKLLDAGLVKEIKAKPGMPPWRRDEETGQLHSLKLTLVGLKAISVDGGDESKAATRAPTPLDQAANAPAIPETTSLPAASPALHSTAGSSTLSPRDGTKLAQVIRLLRRDVGATLAELAAATDWPPHTTRAALTGLRKRGYEVTLDRTDKERGSTYRTGAGEDVAEDDRTLSGDETSSHSIAGSLAAEGPSTSEGRSKASVRSVKRQRVLRSPKRNAA